MSNMLRQCCVAIICATLLQFVMCYNGSDNPDYEPYSEIPCLIRGGICVKSFDCPSGKQSNEKGLCPVQQKMGYECCYSVPLSETRCQRNGGECIPRQSQCPENLTFRRATDCDYSEKCCILV